MLPLGFMPLDGVIPDAGVAAEDASDMFPMLVESAPVDAALTPKEEGSAPEGATLAEEGKALVFDAPPDKTD